MNDEKEMKNMPEPVIEATNLSYSYQKGNQAVKNISFQIKKGERFGFLGPNGSGKSTTQKY